MIFFKIYENMKVDQQFLAMQPFSLISWQLYLLWLLEHYNLNLLFKVLKHKKINTKKVKITE